MSFRAAARRAAILSFSLLGTLTFTASVPGPGDGRWERLRSMPREERVRLAGQLKTFDTLDAKEQQAVRSLDSALAAEPDENRDTYYAVLRRYHLWLSGLTEAQRAEIASKPPESRLAAVTKLVKEQSNKRADLLQRALGEFGKFSPFELANLIKVWNQLDQKEQADVAKQAEGQRYNRIRQLANSRRVRNITRPDDPALDALYETAVKNDPNLGTPAKADEKKKARVRRLVSEYAWLTQHPPVKVSPDRLYQFERSLPSWVRSNIEDAPPSEARWLLSNLYRLIYPPGQEIEPNRKAAGPAPAVTAPAAAKASGPASPKPAPRKDATPPKLPAPAPPNRPF